MSNRPHIEAVTDLDHARGRRAPVHEAMELIVISDTTVTRHPLRPGMLVIGRGQEADIRIASTAVSRRHARLFVGETVQIEDCGSRNGTFVRGVALAPGALGAFAVGEVIELGGSVTLLVQHAASSATTAGAEPTPDSNNLEVLLPRIAKSPISVIFEGETGVGKEVFAHRLHAASARANGPLVVINCAAVSETLLESELFGYERGAFTGATQAKLGLIETANGGTVLLDEIGEMPLPLQSKLLRVMEQREVLPVGALHPRSVDIRVVCATHRNLAAEVAAGRFRQDLWFRLNGITLHIAPLRTRRAEISPLAETFAREMATEMKLASSPGLSTEARSRLLAHPWPGNVRELRNVIRRAVVLAGEQLLRVEHILLGIEDISSHQQTSAVPTRPTPRQLKEEVKDLERERVVTALAQAEGNQSRAAKLLGVARGTLIARMRAYGLARPRKR